MAAEQMEFEQLLCSLLSTDNEIRRQAEEAYFNLPRDVKITELLAAIYNEQMSEEARLMAAVVLRGVFADDFQDFYNELSQKAKDAFLWQILFAVELEVSSNLRQKICEVAAEAARNFIDDVGNNQWPEILLFLFQFGNSPIAKHQETALRIFVSLPGIFGNRQIQDLGLIKRMLKKSLDPSVEFEVRCQGVRAIVAFILFNDEDTPIQNYFSDLLPAVMAVIVDSIQVYDDDSLVKLLIDLSEGCPKFLRPQLEEIFEICMAVFTTTSTEDHLRCLVLEVMLSLSENDAPMVREKAEQYIVALIPFILEKVTESDDDTEWGAETSLKRLACSLGGHIMLPYVVYALPTMLSNSNWKQRYTALLAICVIAEGCHEQMEAMLDDIMMCIMAFMRDPQPIVREAACNAIGLMSLDFSPIFEEKFHEDVISGLLLLLCDERHPLVQVQAGAALANFNAECPNRILSRYLHGVMNNMRLILTTTFKKFVKNGNSVVLEQVITTISSFAHICGEKFTIYYDRLMPLLKVIIHNNEIEELRLLRGKTIECISIIGLAVGDKKFSSDTNEVMEIFLKIHTESDNLPDDDPITSYLICAWNRLRKVLINQFRLYLPLIIDSALQIAATKPKITLLNDDAAEDFKGDVNWAIFYMGIDEYLAIRTVCIQNKVFACEMLVSFAEELDDGFSDYASRVVYAILPLLFYYFHEEVRAVAAASLPCFLHCARYNGLRFLKEIWLYVCPKLLMAITTEAVPRVQFEMLCSLAKIIDVVGPICFSRSHINEVLKIISKYMADHLEKTDKRKGAANNNDYDDYFEEISAADNDTDTDILCSIVDVVHALFSNYRVEFLPYFDRVAHCFIELLEPSRSWTDKRWGLCIFDDVVDYCGPLCIQYEEVYTHMMLKYVADESAEIQQAAIYGCGALAEFGGQEFALTCARAVPFLVEIAIAPKSPQTEVLLLAENAISTIAKILKFNSSEIPNKDELIELWLSWLPVGENEKELPIIYDFFCDLIETEHPAVLGDNNLRRIITLIAGAFSAGLVSPTSESGTRMVQIVKYLESNLEMFPECVNALSPEQKLALEDACRNGS